MFDLWVNTACHRANDKSQQLLEEAARNRLARIAGAQNITLNQQFILWFSSILISGGVKLKRRYYQQQRSQGYPSLAPLESRMEY